MSRFCAFRAIVNIEIYVSVCAYSHIKVLCPLKKEQLSVNVHLHSNRATSEPLESLLKRLRMVSCTVSAVPAVNAASIIVFISCS